MSFPAKLAELGDRSLDRLARVGASLVYTEHVRKETADPLGGGELAREKQIEEAMELEMKRLERRNTMA